MNESSPNQTLDRFLARSATFLSAGTLVIAGLAISGCLADDVELEGPSENGDSGDDSGGDDDPPVTPTETYTVSGTIEGLAAELSLSLNEIENVTVVGASEFSFEEELEEGEGYEVTIGEEPGGQYCQVENGQGTISDDVSDVHVLCEMQTVTGLATPYSKRVDLDWEPTGAGSYHVYWSSDPDFDPGNLAAYPDSGSAASVNPPYEVDELTPGTNYYFRIETLVNDQSAMGGIADTRTQIPGMGFEARYIEQTDEYTFMSGDKGTGEGPGVIGYIAAGFELIDLESGLRRAQPAFSNDIGTLRNQVPDISSILAVNDDTLIVAGDVYGSNGENEHFGLSKIDGNGAVVSDWQPELADRSGRPDIEAMTYHEDSGILYVGGSFHDDDAPVEASESIAAIDVETGEVLDWPIRIGDGSHNSGIRSMHLAGDTLYVAGDFEEIIDKASNETVARSHLAAFDVDGDPSLEDWAPDELMDAAHSMAGFQSGASQMLLVVDDDRKLRAFDSSGNEDADYFSEINSMEYAGAEDAYFYEGDLYIRGWFEDVDGNEFTLLMTQSDGSVLQEWEWQEIGWVYSFSELEEDLLAVHEGAERNNEFPVSYLDDGQITLYRELRLDEAPAVLEAWGDRLALGGDFKLHDLVDRGLLAVLDSELEWAMDWPDILDARRARGMVLDEEEGRLYLAGVFEEVVDGDQTYDVPNLTAIDLEDQSVVENWPEESPDSFVRVRYLDQAGDMLLVGGQFDEWGGDSQFSQFIAIDHDGQALANFPEMRDEGDPLSYGPSATAYDAADNHLYIAGGFDELEGVNGFEGRDHLARVDLSDIANPVLDDWAENMETFGHGSRVIETLVLRAGEGALYASMGGLDEIDDGSGLVDRDGFFAVTADTGDMELMSWDPDAGGSGTLPRHAVWDGRYSELILGRDARMPGSRARIPVAVRVDTSGNELDSIGSGAERPESRSISIRESDRRMCFGMEDRDPRQTDDGSYRMGIICFDDQYELAW